MTRDRRQKWLARVIKAHTIVNPDYKQPNPADLFEDHLLCLSTINIAGWFLVLFLVVSKRVGYRLNKNYLSNHTASTFIGK